MRIGTTPTHAFELPADIVSAVTKVRVIYKQGETIVLKKETDMLSGNTVSFKLTQEETLKFVPNEPVSLQVRVLTAAGDSLVSNIFSVTPFQCLEKLLICCSGYSVQPVGSFS